MLDMKENEQLELFNVCKSSFDAEKSTYNKRKHILFSERLKLIRFLNYR